MPYLRKKPYLRKSLICEKAQRDQLRGIEQGSITNCRDKRARACDLAAAKPGGSAALALEPHREKSMRNGRKSVQRRKQSRSSVAAAAAECVCAGHPFVFLSQQGRGHAPCPSTPPGHHSAQRPAPWAHLKPTACRAAANAAHRRPAATAKGAPPQSRHMQLS
jgi:hypothetical protein